MATTVAALTLATPTTCTLAGVDVTTILAAGGLVGDITPSVTPNTFVNTGKTLFLHMNGSASPNTVTFNAGSCNFGTDHDLSKTTAAGAKSIVGPFPVSEFGTLVTFACGAADTDVASITALILEVPFVN